MDPNNRVRPFMILASRSLLDIHNIVSFWQHLRPQLTALAADLTAPRKDCLIELSGQEGVLNLHRQGLSQATIFQRRWRY